LTFGRDYHLAAAETRLNEIKSEAPILNGDTLLGWPDYQVGRVAIIFSTLFVAPARRRLGDWDTQCYLNSNDANVLYRAQLDVYHQWIEDSPERFRLILTKPDLAQTLADWENREKTSHPVGLVVLMEGAEGVRSPQELEEWWQFGVRLIGPAWAGTRFCGGTREPGPLTPQGYTLLGVMREFGFTLDVSHMDEQAVLQSLDYYSGSVVATHANVKALLKGLDSNRHLSDRVLRGLIDRGGVIGVVPFNSFLKVGWKSGDRRDVVSLSDLVSHIDYVCQLAGNAHHAGLGSDFDGGFGLQSTPAEIDTIADLQKIVFLLSKKGYTEEDIAAIMGQNWVALLQRSLPEKQ
jgi:membrane dipeptidase